MGQLVKLQDYISRYETDIYKYPGQFIRLKKDQYERLVARWEQEQQGVFTGEPDLENHAEKEPSFFKRFFQRKEEVDDPEDEDEVMALPEREEDVKQFFLDQVFDTQLIWASSTLQEVSYFDKGYERDPWLKYFLQRFPDTYLVFYQPSFKLKNATLDAEVIMLTPTEVMCVSILDRDYQDAVFYPSDDRKWTVMKDEQEKSIVNPVIKLKRMEKLVQSIFDYYEVDFPIKKYLLAQQNQIVHQSLPFQTEYIDQTNYPEWFHKQRESKYPIKAQQLKACEKMLEHTLRHYVKRPVWLDDERRIGFEES
ncbi:NERD domain-containing protein [Piscibacillus salipiscarius]|uniref:NERD domain-containing protein n=2 Tax=Piscibacillus salipiscarius TaxID=299480 RepID=A0ABW5QE03_9BACI